MNVKRRFGLGSKELWITDNWRVYHKWVATHVGDDFEEETPPPPTTQGRCVGSFVWVRDFRRIHYLVHELIHAVDAWMESVGLSNDTELRAYAVQDMLEAVMKKLGRIQK